jgi:hypothetical protein
MHVIGACYALDGRHREAEEMFLQSGELYEGLFGSADCRTLINCSSLAYAYQGMDQQGRSIRIFENVLEHHEQARGLDNRGAVEVMGNTVMEY